MGSERHIFTIFLAAHNNSVFESAAYHLRLYFKIWKHVVFPFIREIYLSGFLDMCHQHNTGNYQIVGHVIISRVAALEIKAMDLYEHWSCHLIYISEGPSWTWSYGSWFSNYMYNQCISPLMLWVRKPLMRGVLDSTLCDKVCQWLTTSRWLSPGTPVSSTNKTDRHDITEIFLKVTLNTINQPTNEK
jgi:hypothetical protein